MRILAEGLETFLQSLGYETWHPEMQRTADQAWCITALRQVVTQAVVHKVGHALCRCSLLHVTLLPALFLHNLLEIHHRQWVFLQILCGEMGSLCRIRPRNTMVDDELGYILRMRLYHHSRITPGSATIARTHTVYHQLLRTRCRRDHETARTHAETIHATSIYLGNKAILGCRKIFAPAVLVMILYLVDKLGWMLQSHAHGDSLGLYLDFT